MNNTAMDLNQFTGTEQWIRHPLNPKMLWTEGVDYFADKARAYWFIDLVALGIYGEPGIVSAMKKEKEGFAVVMLHVKNGKAMVEAFDDVPGRCLYHAGVDWTDCPEGEWKFYLVDDGEHVTLLLPGEY
jgi:hypothetical protein